MDDYFQRIDRIIKEGIRKNLRYLEAKQKYTKDTKNVLERITRFLKRSPRTNSFEDLLLLMEKSRFYNTYDNFKRNITFERTFMVSKLDENSIEFLWTLHDGKFDRKDMLSAFYELISNEIIFIQNIYGFLERLGVVISKNNYSFVKTSKFKVFIDKFLPEVRQIGALLRK